MNTSEFNAQKIEPIKNELAALGWSINDTDYHIEFIRDSVRVFFTPENYTNKKYTARVYPVGLNNYRDLSYSTRYEFLPSLKARNVTEKTKPSKIVEHLESLYAECVQAFNDEISLQNKIKAAEKERAEKLERLKNLFNGEIYDEKVEFYHNGSKYLNSLSINGDGISLSIRGLTFDQLIAIKNILEA